jgi:hypothetical protein
LTEEEVNLALDTVLRGLEEGQVVLLMELNRRRAEGLVPDAEMLEFGAGTAAVVRGVLGQDPGKPLTVPQLREVARDLAEKMQAELDRRRGRLQ